MDDLIYFSIADVYFYDQSVRDQSYQHHGWFNLERFEPWLMHFNSRVGPIDTPWVLGPTVSPIPKTDPNIEKRFDLVIETIADELINLVKKSGRKPFLCWSGGIDSTAILVSLLKTGDKDFLQNLTLLISKEIWVENPYFYQHFVKDKIACQDIDQFQINADNLDKIIVIDGEAGNQVVGQGATHNTLNYRGTADVLDRKWKEFDDLDQLVTERNPFYHELTLDSIEKSPVPIETVFDYFWWRGFNFRMDDVLLRKMVRYCQYLTPEQSSEFWNHGLYRVYAHDKMQQWSMATLNERRESWKKQLKFEPKKYIYDYDHNPFWFNFKKQETSGSKSFFKVMFGRSVFAFDRKWNKYSFADPEHRSALGKILGKK